jgi:hypothetical protein
MGSPVLERRVNFGQVRGVGLDSRRLERIHSKLRLLGKFADCSRVARVRPEDGGGQLRARRRKGGRTRRQHCRGAVHCVVSSSAQTRRCLVRDNSRRLAPYKRSLALVRDSNCLDVGRLVTECLKLLDCLIDTYNHSVDWMCTQVSAGSKRMGSGRVGAPRSCSDHCQHILSDPLKYPLRTNVREYLVELDLVNCDDLTLPPTCISVWPRDSTGRDSQARRRR